MKFRYGVILLSLIVTALFLCYRVFVTGDASVYKENGVLENLQVLLIGISGVLFLTESLNKHRQDRWFFGFLSFLCLAFFLREIDVERFSLPSIVIFLGSGIGRNSILFVIFSILMVYGVMHRHYYFRLGLSLIKTSACVLFISAAVLLYIGGLFEDFTMRHNVFYEELIEFLGYGVLLLAGVTLATESPYQDKIKR